MGCSNSKAGGDGPQPEPLPKGKGSQGGNKTAEAPPLDETLMRMLEDAQLADHAGIRKALAENNCSMDTLRDLRDAGTLRETIAKYGLDEAAAARLEVAVLSALGTDTDKEMEEKAKGASAAETGTGANSTADKTDKVDKDEKADGAEAEKADEAGNVGSGDEHSVGKNAEGNTVPHDSRHMLAGENAAAPVRASAAWGKNSIGWIKPPWT